MGSGTSCYIGKSYYEEDTFFKGGIDNVKIYDHALTASEISEWSAVRGDVNADGQFSVADLTAMQNWLLGISDGLSNWQAGDLAENGRLDVFDLVMMRKLLVS